MSSQHQESGAESAGAAAGAAPSRALRADAERNRARLVEAARSVFAETGVDSPLENIAERAGVGIATLYRRFPTREELIAATYEAKMAEITDFTEEALHAPDAWTGLRDCIERFCAMQSENRGFSSAVIMALPVPAVVPPHRERLRTNLAALIERAQEEGSLRDDFVLEDITLLMMATGGILRVTREAAPHAWRRLLAYQLEAFRTPGSAGPADPLPTAPTAMQLRRAAEAHRARLRQSPPASSPVG
ncbi:TetR/AcrR family transcriptional regulator [Streptomyces paludis]|uniref:TetR/AcrR family transcriptional regulator n=1 Tax=Streptomyces paludis TaxID=2282738 RepID=A0A345HJA6_9ACTN|nr:TetR/AcrR family transcriptional regulator [Streptomyces paludis]AXG76780.1 TetR/AcrR family transcriptional regulator [Streptomyces paludis]